MKRNKNLAGRSRSCRRESATDFSKSGPTGDEKKAPELARLLELWMIHGRPRRQAKQKELTDNTAPGTGLACACRVEYG